MVLNWNCWLMSVVVPIAKKKKAAPFVTRANLERYVVKPAVAFVSPAVEAVKNRS